MKKVRTVKGDIAPAELGITSMHEHTVSDFSEMFARIKAYMPPMPESMKKNIPENFRFFNDGGYVLCEDDYLGSVDFYVKEIGYFEELGGKTIVDASPIGMRKTADIKRLSELINVNIVCCTGLYTAEDRPDRTKSWSPEQQKEIFEKEILEGMDGLDIKPGFLKAALTGPDENGDRYKKTEEETVLVCAELAAKYGMSMQIHPQNVPNEDMLDMIDRILALGMDPDKLIILHQGINGIPMELYVTDWNAVVSYNLEERLKILEKGVNIGIDDFGFPLGYMGFCMTNDYDRLRLLVALIKEGYSDKIILGHDFAHAAYSKARGNYGYTRTLGFVMPMLRQLSIEEKVIQQLFVDTPARILAF